jgi:putative CocE/NonD family hydrolase
MRFPRPLVSAASLGTALALIALLAVPVRSSRAQPAFDFRARYTKYEYQIPMRDGVKLFTAVYVPKDASQAYPIMLNRTPYSVGPYGANAYPGGAGPSRRFEEEGFIFARQDVRGRFMSEGEFVNMRPEGHAKPGTKEIDESTDTYDTIEWLLKNIPNNNGRVGLSGISYPGFYAAAGMIDSHPALKAVSPQAPIADWFIGDDFHHNGAFFLFDAFAFFSGFGRPRSGPTTSYPGRFTYGTPDGYQFFLGLGPLRDANERHFHNEIAFWNDLMQHGTYDSFWKARNLLPHLKNIHAAVMTVGGWFDAEDLYGPLKIYQAVERANPGIRNRLVMGPWSHGGWSRADGSMLGDIRFGSNTSAFYRDEVEFPFFNYHLKGKGSLKEPEALVFNTGANRWLSFETWPPRDLKAKSLYFRAGGDLSFDAPSEKSAASFDEYLADPAKPVPYLPDVTINRGVDYMINDQRFAARRPDVLLYQTEPLATDLTLAGPLNAELFVVSTGTDADFVVKLVDVYPNDAPDNDPNPRGARMGGYEMLVRAEVMRARFRRSYERPEPLVPGRVTPVRFELRDVCHTFQKGHRVMVQVQSSWFPLVDRNPQKFVDIYQATETDFRKATQRIYHSAEFPSRLQVGVRGE